MFQLPIRTARVALLGALFAVAPGVVGAQETEAPVCTATVDAAHAVATTPNSKYGTQRGLPRARSKAATPRAIAMPRLTRPRVRNSE